MGVLHQLVCSDNLHSIASITYLEGFVCVCGWGGGGCTQPLYRLPYVAAFPEFSMDTRVCVCKDCIMSSFQPLSAQHVLKFLPG